LHGIGRAIAQAVSPRLPTAMAQVRARVWSSGICGGQSGAGARILRVIRFPLPIFIPQNSPSSQSPGADTVGQLVVDMPSAHSLDSTPYYTFCMEYTDESLFKLFLQELNIKETTRQMFT
jgi:hypothetical protein